MDANRKPNPDDWMTRAAVADLFDVQPSTVMRWAQDGVLAEYEPVKGRSDIAGRYLYWRPEVQELHAAHQRLKRRA